jgi:HlyD family secretion protein
MMTDTVLIPSPIWGFPTSKGPKPARPASDPRRELRMGGAIIAAFLIFGVGWAAIAPLNSAVEAHGVVKVSGERQKVQTLHEGIISQLNVHEGQLVHRGDVLVQFATADALASERALAAQAIGLQAQVARFQAQQVGATTITSPAAFAAYTDGDRVLADRALQLETETLAAVNRAHGAEQAVLRQKAAQIRDQIGGNAAHGVASERQRALLGQEVDSISSLARQGYASKNRLLEIQRQAADLDGTIGTIDADTARLRTAIGETRLQSVQSDSDRLQAATDRLRDAQTQLQSALPQWATARDQLARTQVRAPVTGMVVGLDVHTVGGVAANGQTLMEIVPAATALTIEAKVAPNEINQLHVGQAARLRVTALHGRNVPQLAGRITRLSADSFTDEKTGVSYYLMNVEVPQTELARLRKAEGDAGRLRPGNPMEVMVTLHARSALSYWLEPMTQTLGDAMHGQ